MELEREEIESMFLVNNYSVFCLICLNNSDRKIENIHYKDDFRKKTNPSLGEKPGSLTNTDRILWNWTVTAFTVSGNSEGMPGIYFPVK